MSNVKLTTESKNWEVSAVRIYNTNSNLTLDVSGNNNLIVTTDSSNVAVFGSNIIDGTTYNKSLNVNGPYFSNNVSAFLLPADTSNNRPTGQIGYIRYNTNTNFMEYWRGSVSTWIPISEGPPTLSSISPSYIAQDVSSTLYTIIGENFNSSTNVSFIGNNNPSVELPVAAVTYNTATNLSVYISDAIADASNNSFYAVKVINSDTGLFTTSGYIVSYNEAPYWNTPDPTSLGTGTGNETYTYSTTPFSDLSASDPPPAHLPITYFATTNPPSSAAPLVTLDPSGRLIGTMPLSGSLTTYNFQAYAQDASGSRSPIYTFNFSVTPPLLTLTYSSGASLPTPIYVNSSNTIVGGPVAGGFTIYSFVVSTNQYTSTTFAFQINAPASTHFLCVGGGGGAAGYNSCGGGGAGGFRTSYTTTQGTSGGGGAYESTLTLTSSNTYTVVVGGGSRGVPGDGGTYSGSPASVAQGWASSISENGVTTIISYGGSPGACGQAGATKPQDYVNQVATGSQPSAGSGGGSRNASPDNVGGTGTAGQGYNGGSNASYTGNYPGGGGGGAGSVGQTAATSQAGGNGGSGLQSAITGTLQYYAGGGGGSTQASGASDPGGGGSAPAGSGGSGVGGNGRGANGTALNGFDGASNTGSGGGAGCNCGTPSVGKGGDGSAGIVVIRLPSYYV